MATNNTDNRIRFFFNGIKLGKGKLQKAHFSYQAAEGPSRWRPEGIPESLTIYGDRYCGQSFCPVVWAAIGAENTCDTMTDYFAHDSAHLDSAHPLFADALAAYVKQERRAVKRLTRRGLLEQAAALNAKLDSVEARIVELAQSGPVSAPAAAPVAAPAEVEIDAHAAFLASLGVVGGAQ